MKTTTEREVNVMDTEVDVKDEKINKSM